MTTQELMLEHYNDKCKYCDGKNCDGIRITEKNTTRCNRDEKKR